MNAGLPVMRVLSRMMKTSWLPLLEREEGRVSPGRCLGTALAVVLGMIGGLGGGPRPGGAAEPEVLEVENEALRATWQSGEQSFQLMHKPSGRIFVSSGRWPVAEGEAGAGQVKPVEMEPWGQGWALEIGYPEGRGARMLMFPGLPFVLLQGTMINLGPGQERVRTVPLVALDLSVGRSSSELKVLGTSGLTGVGGHTGSYVFLAVADPQTRRGVVGAWLTHDRGSGVVFTSEVNQQVRLEARIDYGRLLIPSGQKADTETFVLGWFEDARLGLEQYADLVARHYRIRLRPQLDGYCTWYSSPHGGASDETHLAELGGFAARELKPFGFDFIQIDDYWQDGRRRNGPAKVFVRHKPDGPYPSGMKAAADGLKGMGLRPGLWFMPFAADRQDPFFEGKHDWFVKRADGSPYFVNWGGTSLDLTHPGVRDYVAGVARRIAREWGYDYFKMDGLWTGMAAELLYVHNAYRPDDLGEGVVARPEVTPVEAYRSGLRLVREAAGDGVFFLGCNVSQNMRSFGASFGLLDAMRIGPDNGPDWGSLQRGPWHGANRYFLHGRVWYNDPDPLYVRASMPLEHARLIGSWVGVSGQLNVSSDWLPGLPPERLELLKRTLPSHGLRPRPVDLFEADMPRLWLLTDERQGVRRDVVGVFNWDETRPARVTCDVAKLGLPEADGYVGFDFWADRFVAPFAESLAVELPPASCRVLAVRPQAACPVVVSTSRHISQGMVDLAGEQWDAEEGVLSAASRLVGGDSYEVRMVVPVGNHSWRLRSVSLDRAPAGAEVSFEQTGPKVRVRLVSAESGEVAWRAHFEKARVEVSVLRSPSLLRAEASHDRVVLTWGAGEAEAFQVVRQGAGGERANGLCEGRWEDQDVQADTVYRYIVRARNWLGEWSEPSEVEARVPAAPRRPPWPPRPDIVLSGLEPVQARTGWGKLGIDRSCQDHPLTVGGQQYERGLGVHAPARLVYVIPPGAARFVAVVGIDDEVKSDARASVRFGVYGQADREGNGLALLAESPDLSDRTLRVWCFDVRLTEGLGLIRLEVGDAGDGISADHADWVEAGFLK